MKLSRILFYKKKHKMHIFKLFIEKSKTWRKLFMLGSYCFNKIAVGLNNGLDTASELSAGSHDQVYVHGGEYLGDGGHQAGLILWECLLVCLSDLRQNST